MENITPKEKAKELIEKYSDSIESTLEYVDETIRIISWGADIPAKIKNESKEYYTSVKKELEIIKNK